MNLQDFAKNGKKIVAVTTNYTGMLKQLNMPRPEKPTVFMKPTSAYITEGQKIQIPPGFSVNQEVELGIVIGQKCKNIKEHQVMDFIGGYCVALDMTATCQMVNKLLYTVQLKIQDEDFFLKFPMVLDSEFYEARSKGLPWLIGKGFDSACPVSRFITKEEICNIDNVQLWCNVNGKLQQDGNTSDFVFAVPSLISYITQFITLEPNDVVLTGSPPGMGPVVSGDIIEGGIKNILSFCFAVQ